MEQETGWGRLGNDLVKAEPCWKTAWPSVSKLVSVLPSNPTPDAIAGSEYEAVPKLSVPIASAVLAILLG
jgi:hypothetical protein